VSTSRCHIHERVKGTAIGSDICPLCARMVEMAKAPTTRMHAMSGEALRKSASNRGGSPWRAQRYSAGPRDVVGLTGLAKVAGQ
jgi:hypothetical protein